MSALSPAYAMLLVWLILIVAALIGGLVLALVMMRRANPPRAIREHTEAWWR